jgi:hypothetical protein
MVELARALAQSRVAVHGSFGSVLRDVYRAVRETAMNFLTRRLRRRRHERQPDLLLLAYLRVFNAPRIYYDNE